ncbi:hypothetical protein JOM56_004484 [Amanita muscaria]
MMHSAITVFFPTPAMFDAGRQPLASIHFNTQTKTKRSVKGKKADNVFLPQATGTHTQIPTNCVDACDLSADEDIPLALLKQLRSASLKYAPPPAPETVTLRRPRVEPKKPALQFIPVQPKKATILYPVGPVRPMMCIVRDCPHDWHIHINPSNLFQHGTGWRLATEDTKTRPRKERRQDRLHPRSKELMNSGLRRILAQVPFTLTSRLVARFNPGLKIGPLFPGDDASLVVGPGLKTRRSCVSN